MYATKMAEALEKTDDYVKALEEEVASLKATVASLKAKSLKSEVEEDDDEDEDDAVKVARRVYYASNNTISPEVIDQIAGLDPGLLAKLAVAFSAEGQGVPLGRAASKHASRYLDELNGPVGNEARARLIAFLAS